MHAYIHEQVFSTISYEDLYIHSHIYTHTYIHTHAYMHTYIHEQVFSTISYEELYVLRGHTLGIRTCIFSSDSKRVLSSGSDAQVPNHTYIHIHACMYACVHRSKESALVRSNGQVPNAYIHTYTYIHIGAQCIHTYIYIHTYRCLMHTYIYECHNYMNKVPQDA